PCVDSKACRGRLDSRDGQRVRRTRKPGFPLVSLPRDRDVSNPMARIAESDRTAIDRRPAATGPGRADDDPYGRWTLGVILTVLLCQVAFLLVGCEWDFSGDEAEYWAWSRRLDWSYYARGPLIAWLIRLATELLGGLSLQSTGSLMLAARLPAVLLGGL